ncbi:MAG TPA: hypothetical protein PK657_14770 [Legionella sp.]|nr:hypothetical protein [Legionella sp.]
MGKKDVVNDNYWKFQVESQLKNDYSEFLKKENMEPSPHAAQCFAMRKLSGGVEYQGYKERDIILLLEGKLPFLYD